MKDFLMVDHLWSGVRGWGATLASPSIVTAPLSAAGATTSDRAAMTEVPVAAPGSPPLLDAPQSSSASLGG